MGTILASAVISSMRVTLLDPAPGDWSDPDLLAFVRSAEAQVCVLRPDAYRVLGNINMAAGIQQSLPAGGTVLMNILENVGSGNRTCTLVNRDLLDSTLRAWPNATQEVVVQEWAVDPRDPNHFIISPPNTGAGVVRALYCATPAAIAAVGSAINVDDEFEPALRYFALAEAYSANTKRRDPTKEQSYRTLATNLLGVNQQSRIALIAKLIGQGGQ